MFIMKIYSKLYSSLFLGLAAGYVLGTMIVLVMQQVLSMHPSVNLILFTSAGWCGLLFYFVTLFRMLLA